MSNGCSKMAFSSGARPSPRSCIVGTLLGGRHRSIGEQREDLVEVGAPITSRGEDADGVLHCRHHIVPHIGQRPASGQRPQGGTVPERHRHRLQHRLELGRLGEAGDQFLRPRQVVSRRIIGDGCLRLHLPEYGGEDILGATDVVLDRIDGGGVRHLVDDRVRHHIWVVAHRLVHVDLVLGGIVVGASWPAARLAHRRVGDEVYLYVADQTL